MPSVWLVVFFFFTVSWLVPWPGIEPRPSALGLQTLNHWTTREISRLWYFSHLLHPSYNIDWEFIHTRYTLKFWFPKDEYKALLLSLRIANNPGQRYSSSFIYLGVFCLFVFSFFSLDLSGKLESNSSRSLLKSDLTFGIKMFPWVISLFLCRAAWIPSLKYRQYPSITMMESLFIVEGGSKIKWPHETAWRPFNGIPALSEAKAKAKSQPQEHYKLSAIPAVFNKLTYWLQRVDQHDKDRLSEYPEKKQSP